MQTNLNLSLKLIFFTDHMQLRSPGRTLKRIEQLNRMGKFRLIGDYLIVLRITVVALTKLMALVMDCHLSIGQTNRGHCHPVQLVIFP